MKKKTPKCTSTNPTTWIRYLLGVFFVLNVLDIISTLAFMVRQKAFFEIEANILHAILGSTAEAFSLVVFIKVIVMAGMVYLIFNLKEVRIEPQLTSILTIFIVIMIVVVTSNFHAVFTTPQDTAEPVPSEERIVNYVIIVSPVVLIGIVIIFADFFKNISCKRKGLHWHKSFVLKNGVEF